MNSVSPLSLAIASSNAPVVTGSAGPATDAPQLFAAILAPFDAAATAAVRQSIAAPGNALPQTTPENIEMPTDAAIATRSSISLATTSAEPRRTPPSLAGQPLPSNLPLASDAPQPETDHATSLDDEGRSAKHRWDQDDEAADPGIAWCAVLVAPPAARPIAFSISPASTLPVAEAISSTPVRAFDSAPVVLASNPIHAVSPQRAIPTIEGAPVPIATGIVTAYPAPSPINRTLEPQRPSFAIEPPLQTIEVPLSSPSRRPSFINDSSPASASITVPASWMSHANVAPLQPTSTEASATIAPSGLAVVQTLSQPMPHQFARALTPKPSKFAIESSAPPMQDAAGRSRLTRPERGSIVLPAITATPEIAPDSIESIAAPVLTTHDGRSPLRLAESALKIAIDVKTGASLKVVPADVPVRRQAASLAPPQPAIVVSSNTTPMTGAAAANAPTRPIADAIQAQRSPTAIAPIAVPESAVVVGPTSRPETSPTRPVLLQPRPFAIESPAPVASAPISPPPKAASGTVRVVPPGAIEAQQPLAATSVLPVPLPVAMQPTIAAPRPIQISITGIVGATGLTLPIGPGSALAPVVNDVTAAAVPPAMTSIEAAPARPVETSPVKPSIVQPSIVANPTAAASVAVAPPSPQTAPIAMTSPKRTRIETATAGDVALASLAHAHTAPATAVAPNPPLDMGRHGWPQAIIERIEALRDAADAVDTSIRIVPDKLGTIDVSVRRVGDVTHVHFAAEQAQTRTILADAQPRLAELADSRGLKLGQSSIDGGTGQHQPQNQRAQTAFVPAAPARAPRRDEGAADHRIA